VIGRLALGVHTSSSGRLPVADSSDQVMRAAAGGFDEGPAAHAEARVDRRVTEIVGTVDAVIVPAGSHVRASAVSRRDLAATGRCRSAAATTTNPGVDGVLAGQLERIVQWGTSDQDKR